MGKVVAIEQGRRKQDDAVAGDILELPGPDHSSINLAEDALVPDAERSFRIYGDKATGDVYLLPHLRDTTGLRQFDTAAKATGQLTSETPEPVTYWRQAYAEAPGVAKGVAELWIARGGMLERTASRKKWRAGATATMTALRKLRGQLDHIEVLLKGLTARDAAKLRDKIASVARTYKNLAVGIYGNAWPIVADTGAPALPGGDAEMIPSLVPFITLPDAEMHEEDGLAFGHVAQGAGLYDSVLRQGHQAHYTEIMPLGMRIGSVLLTLTGVIAAASAKSASQAALDKADRTVRWAEDRARKARP